MVGPWWWWWGVTLQITHLKCDCEGAGGNQCFSLKVQIFEIFVVITGGNNLFYWWTRGRKCASRQVLISRLCPVLEKDRILCHCSPGHQLFNFIISTYDRYFSSLGNLGINRRANNLCQRSFGNGTKTYHVGLKNTLGTLLAGIILIYWWIHGVIRRLVFLGVINLETVPGSYGICAEALIKSKQSMPQTFSGVFLFSQTEEGDVRAVSWLRQQWEL